MKKLIFVALLSCAYGCGSDDSGNVDNSNTAGSPGASGSSGKAGQGGSSASAGSHSGGTGNSVGDAAPDSAAGESGADMGGASGSPNLGNAGAAGALGIAGSAGDNGLSPSSCAAARAQLLGSVDSVSTGEVSVVSNSGGVVTLYVGATAGGTAAALQNPWIFVSLASSSKVAVTDVSSISSVAWDLALKRPLLYTNGGDGGPGRGGAVWIAKTFAEVTAADAVGVGFEEEKFYDAECNPNLDPTGAALTTLATWYDYDSTTHALSPHPGTWLLHGADGKLFKLHVKTYYGMPDGSTGTAGGAYLLEVAAL